MCSALGFTELIFIEPAVKINGEYYRDILLSQHLLTATRNISGSEFFTFQQDNVSAHRAKESMDLLSRCTPDFIGLSMWPPSSPDLNPVDYQFWGVLQQRVYQSRIHNVEQLKDRLIEEWRRFSQDIIDKAIKE